MRVMFVLCDGSAAVQIASRSLPLTCVSCPPMPTLDWVGKQAVVDHHRKVPYRLLHCDKDLSAGDPDAGNLLVQGDNLEALKALLPYYAGQVKCIYIDPPYNTGNEGWVYNDNVNSPEIRKWLGEVVGKEAEDLSRHDKWLCMMYPRLALLREFLREDGAIFVSIDDNEGHYCKALLDEVFGRGNFLATLVWNHSVQTKGYSGSFSVHHNYVHAYQRSGKFVLRDLTRDESHNVNYSNPDGDPRGAWRPGDVRNSLVRPNLMYDIVTPSGKNIRHPPKGWRFKRETFEQELESGKIVFSQDETRIIRKIYLADQEGRVPETLWFPKDVGTTREATAEVREMVGESEQFETPKPVRLIQRILSIATDADSIVFDSFAGTATTAHAVLAQNCADGGRRKFVCIEINERIAVSVTSARTKAAVTGVRADGQPWTRQVSALLDEVPLTVTSIRTGHEVDERLNGCRGEHREEYQEFEKVVEENHFRLYGYRTEVGGGLGSGFRFCRLGKPLFDEHGSIAEGVSFTDLAAHIFFSETGSPIPRKARKDNPLLGTFGGRAIYLLYNGVLGDRRPAGGNVLTHAVAEALPPHPGGGGPRVVFGEATRLGPKALAAYGITFRQIPFSLRVD